MNRSLSEECVTMDRTQTLFGRLMLQSYTGLAMYEKLLKAHEGELRWVVEIGTATGSLSLFFAVWAHLKGWPFLTIDNGAAQWAWPLDERTQGLLQRLGAEVHRENCFQSQRVREFLSGVGAKEPGLLFCDGGKKGKELRTFAPLLPPGSIVVAHDWPTEVGPEDVEATPCVEYHEPWHTVSLEGSTRAAVLRVKESRT